MTQRDVQIDQFGGRCQICGYDRERRALHFHHRDSSEKTKWASSASPYSPHLAEIRAHPERFALLCANCHAEAHAAIDDATAVWSECVRCGTAIRVRPWDKRPGHNQYCGRSCAEADRHPVALAGFADRFWEATERVGECLIWRGPLGAVGFGATSVPQPGGGHRYRAAHHIAYDLTHPDDPLPKHNRLRQSCGNRLCVESAHLVPVIGRGNHWAPTQQS